MSQLVSSIQEVVENIRTFELQVDRSHGLQERLSQARAWYAYQDDEGGWHFGPSKFVGYRNMTAKEYLNGKPRDGRRTEKQLKLWYEELSEKDPKHGMLSEHLHGFLDGYMKIPSALARIMVPKVSYARRDNDTAHSPTLRLILEVAQGLSRDERFILAELLTGDRS